MRAFEIRFLVSNGRGWVGQGRHTCEEHGVGALQARFRQEAQDYWAQHQELVTQVDFREVQTDDDPFVAYATSLGLAVRRTSFAATVTHAVPLDLDTPVPAAIKVLTERFGAVVTLTQDGSVYRQFSVPDVGPDGYVAIETRREEIPQLWLKHNVDATFFPFRY